VTTEGGVATYKTTELRVACPASCAVYANGCDPTSSVLGGEGGGIAGLPGLEVGEDGLVQRSYVSTSRTSTPSRSTAVSGVRDAAESSASDSQPTLDPDTYNVFGGARKEEDDGILLLHLIQEQTDISAGRFLEIETSSTARHTSTSQRSDERINWSGSLSSTRF